MLENTSSKKGLILNFSARIIVSAAICIMIIMANGDRAVAAEGDTGWYGNLGYEELSDGTLEITYCSLENGVTGISVPETINGKKVTQIGNGAFSLFGCSGLKNVVLPSGIRKIGEWAFSGLEDMESIKLPSGLVSIGYWAFGETGLTEITLPEKLKTLGESAFGDCKNLKSIKVAEGNPYFTAVNGVLYNIKKTKLCAVPAKLTGFSIPKGVTNIGEGAFHGSEIRKIVLPAGVTQISDDAFGGCEHLVSITLPPGLKKIGKYAFDSCCRLTKITLPASLTDIGEGAFSGCENIENFVIPEGITTIKANTFGHCSNLKSIKLPSGLSSIEYAAFYQCHELKSIDIPQKVKSINDILLNSCMKLEKITVSSKNPCFTSIDGVLYDKKKTKLIDFPGAMKTLRILPGVTELKGDFAGFLKSVYIPASVKSINASFAGVRWYVYSGSYAHKYAKEKGYDYTVMKKQTIQASSFTKSYGSRSFSIGAKNSGKGKLTYSSNASKVVSVSSKGVVTVKGYGKATITINASAIAEYDAAVKKITVTVVPEKQTIKSVSSPKKGAISIGWTKNSTVTGYQVNLSPDKNFSKVYSKNFDKSVTGRTVTGLTSNKYWYVRIRSYKTIGNRKYYGSWSTVRSVKIR